MDNSNDGWGNKYNDDIYYFGDDLKAYTEDKIVVYNLFITHVARNVTPGAVWRYFSKYGEIKNVNLKKVQRSSQQRSGFVYFADPLAAAEALKKKTHKVMAKASAVRVNACFSWHQPSIAGDFTETAEKSKNVDTESEAMTLLCLNDDCLAHIYEHLDFSDKIYFAMTHSRFANVASICSKQHFKVFQVETLEYLTLWQQRELVKMFGSNMEAITGIVPYTNRDRIMNFIRGWSPNVNCMKLFSSRIVDKTLSRLLLYMQQITVLELRNCSLTDKNVMAIAKLPNLITLALSENYELTGKYMNMLTTVQDLDIHRCANLQITFIRQALRALTQLVSLNLENCDPIMPNVFQHVNGGCTKLVSLKMCFSENVNYDWVATLPSLKHLELMATTACTPEHDHLFKPLSEYKAEQLESLKLTTINMIGRTQAQYLAKMTQLKHLTCGYNTNFDDACLRELAKMVNLEELDVSYCGSITNAGIMHVLSECLKLRELYLEGCEALTEALPHQVIEVLKRTRTQRNALMVIYVGKTAVTCAIEDDTKYMEALNSNLLKLCFNQFAPRFYADTDEFDSYDDLDLDDDEMDDQDNIYYDLEDLEDY